MTLTDSTPPGPTPEAVVGPAAPLPSTATPAPTPAWARSLHRHRFAFLAACLALVVSLDQASKLWMRDNLARPLPADSRGEVHHRSVRDIYVIRGIFHFRYVENPAAAFSLTRSIPEHVRRPLLIGISYLAMLLLLFWMWRLRDPDAALVVGFSLVLGGAVGNAVDRHWHGYVIDFIDWRLTRFFAELRPWPTFNLADAAIVCGAALIVYRSFFPFPQPARAAATPAPAEFSPTALADRDEGVPT